MFSYDKMELKYMTAIAYQCLIEIEKATRVQSLMVCGVDLETRLANAIRIQHASNDNQSRWLT